MKIKSFKIFESNSITNIEVKNIVDDILLDLKDLSDSFSWQVYISRDPRKLSEFPERETFNNCHLIIKCEDEFTTKNSEWVNILERLFYLLNQEDIKIFDQKESFTEVKPGKINLGWELKARRNPMNFQVESIWWEKDFFLKK
jgi:hypothetical protein